MKKKPFTSLVLLSIGAWSLTSAEPVNLDSGLGVGGPDDRTLTFRELSQGTEFVPIVVLYAIQHQDGQSMLARMNDYGFMRGGSPRPELPVGFTVKERKMRFFELDFSTSGFTCAACHSGEFTYGQQTYRVDGMPGLVDIEGWTLELEEVVKRYKPTSLEGVKLIFDATKRALDYSRRYGDRREKLFGANHLAERSMMAELERSLDALIESQSRLNEAEAAPGGGDGGPFRQEALSEDSRTKAYQLLALGALYGTAEPGGLGRNEFLEEFGDLEKGVMEELFLGENFFPGHRFIQEWRQVLQKMRDELAVLQARFTNGKALLQALRESDPLPGHGRDDAWGLIDLIIGGKRDAQLSTPISIPALFGAGGYRDFHIDGNTNSMMDRNIAQAVALGAKLYPNKNTNIDLPAVHEANLLAAAIKGPRWPDIFPPLDQEKVAKGKQLFEAKSYDQYRVFDYQGQSLPVEKASCADCHQVVDDYRKQRFYRVGTNLKRLEHYPSQPGMLPKIATELAKIRQKTQEAAKIPDEEAAQWEPNGKPWWRSQKGYVAKPLDGIWASAPYLHNGSVPSLADLFLPVAKRPEKFYTGSREFDPIKVGYRTDKVRGSYLFETGAKANGEGSANANAGHEFGTELSAEERECLIEYLKTFSMGNRGKL
ncbi:MAG: di-heme-cytochrome C peroxidase [Verrucomicrobiota bacterium JB023]|nr:di-heme-cytochrome C peroxidase [Verrucomicrobiota bacterium JB023]